jgi:hypothetical protein
MAAIGIYDLRFLIDDLSVAGRLPNRKSPIINRKCHSCDGAPVSLPCPCEPPDETGTTGSLYRSGFAADRLGR